MLEVIPRPGLGSVTRYWYFTSTLPGLVFGAHPPFAQEEFLERCRVHLSPPDFDVCRQALGLAMRDELPLIAESRFLKSYVAWERALRNELAKLRARRAGKPEDTYVRPTEPDVDAIRSAQVCFSAEDPLQGERILETERWKAIERFSALSAFDLDFILAYAFKLSILHRIASLDERAGAAGYNRLYDDILGGLSIAAGSDISGEKA
ncbi:MAG TPA: DUF2764 family protein [Rectinemataceae bacterium]